MRRARRGQLVQVFKKIKSDTSRGARANSRALIADSRPSKWGGGPPRRPTGMAQSLEPKWLAHALKANARTKLATDNNAHSHHDQ